ncbi:hypothetical protein MTX20_09770 [Bradyrhizobium sp. ISRA435]|nr:hypothetical protein MTX20_09770 [Bradyrhizobium sp. ISRA435]
MTAGNVVLGSFSDTAPCALARCRKSALNKAMKAIGAAKAVGLENVGSDLTVEARLTTGRQVTLGGIWQQLSGLRCEMSAGRFAVKKVDGQQRSSLVSIV